MIDLAGAFLPVTTPFDRVTGDVDVVAFRSNLRTWFQAPIRGVLVGGSTGEAVFLDAAERRRLIEAARDVVPADRVLIAGTGTEATRHTIGLTVEAADAGADAVLVSPPAYYKGAMTPDALARHYRAVADASPVPVIVYQVPLRLSTLDLPTGLVAELSRHDNVVGIKDSRGKLELVGELLDQCAAGFQVLVGNGALFYPALEMGAVGGIMASALLAPAEQAEIAVAFAEGRRADAGRIQEQVAPIHTEIVQGLGIRGIKAALDVLGLHGGAPRPPLSAASEADVEKARSVLAAAGLLEKAHA